MFELCEGVLSYPFANILDGSNGGALKVGPPPSEVDEDVVHLSLLQRLLGAVHVLCLATSEGLTGIRE